MRWLRLGRTHKQAMEDGQDKGQLNQILEDQEKEEEQKEPHDNCREGEEEVATESEPQSNTSPVSTSVSDLSESSPGPDGMLSHFNPFSRQAAQVERLTAIQMVVPPGRGVVRSILAVASRLSIRREIEPSSEYTYVTDTGSCHVDTHCTESTCYRL